MKKGLKLFGSFDHLRESWTVGTTDLMKKGLKLDRQRSPSAALILVGTTDLMKKGLKPGNSDESQCFGMSLEPLT